jgi:hypothetical protein
MKTLLLAATLWVSTAAFARYVQPATGPTYQPPSHPETVAALAIGTERSLLGAGGTTSAHAERPLADFPIPITQTYDTPLGEVARAYHLTKKCCICPPHGHSGSIRSEKPQPNPDGRFWWLKSHSRACRRILAHVTAFGFASGQSRSIPNVR